jgi:hypothetical protein
MGATNTLSSFAWVDTSTSEETVVDVRATIDIRPNART